MNKRLTSIVMVAVIVSTITIHVIAIDIPQSSSEKPYTGYFQNLPDSGDGFYIYADSKFDNAWCSVKVQTGKIGFAFLYHDVGNSISIAYVSRERITFYKKPEGGTWTSYQTENKDSTYTDWYVNELSFGGRIINTSSTYTFNSYSDGMNAVINYYNNPVPPSPTVTASSINYSLPSGNIAIIETNSSYNYLNLNTIMPLQSTSFASNPWPNTTQRVGYYNTLPQTLNPNTMGNVIEWERNGNTTLFNVTTNAKYNPSIVSTFKYVVIVNPYYYPANDMEDSQYTNGEINISMDGVVNITVKSLTATVNTQTGAVEDNYNGDEWTGEVDETTNDIIWTDGNGENNAPTSGANLSDPSISGFQSWLKGILNNIVNIFKPAHDAINTLSGAVSNFASWMYSLYVWLPSPILSLLTSAISLAIVIGIIKVFI